MIVHKTFDFHAAHRDEQASSSDKCSRMHGHTYTLTIGVEGFMDNHRGMLIHGDSLKSFYTAHIEPKVEHRNLNETLQFNPTMEKVLHWIADEAAVFFGDYDNVTGVRVELHETKTLGAQTSRQVVHAE